MKPLRDYQIKAIDAVKKELDNGVKKQLLVMATGTGKTFTAVKAIEQFNFQRVLWITHTEELVQQSALAFLSEKFDKELTDAVEDIGFINWVHNGSGMFGCRGIKFRMGLIKADAFYPDGSVVMASAQTLYRRLDKLPKDHFDAIICDEAHLFLSRTFSDPLKYFEPKLLLGLTATPTRLDGMQLGNMFDKIVYSYDIADGVKDGYLCELDAVRIKTDLSLDNVRTTGGEFNAKDLSNEVDIPQRNKLIVDSYKTYAEGRQGIFFCVDIKHSLHLAEEFKSQGIICNAVSSDEESTGDRSQTIKDFKAGKIQVLTNVGILTTGFDHRNTGVIGNCAPTKSLSKYLQCIGRGTRLKDENFIAKYGQNCVILDFVDSTTRHKLINAWSLDSGKATEEKVFMTKAKKKALIDERERKIAYVVATSKKDVKVDLFALPKVYISNSIKMEEPATEKQLAWIARLGYDTVNVEYTKKMCSEIISAQPATEKQIGLLKWKGYDVSNGVTISEFKMALNEIEKRENKEVVNKYTPNNNGNPFF
jgi:superfamily II DNA or RNA helicase